MSNCKFQTQEHGLYQSQYEHDACGVGMVVNIHGNKSHELVDNALRVLENMRHRGAEVGKDGDGFAHVLVVELNIGYGTHLIAVGKDGRCLRKTLQVCKTHLICVVAAYGLAFQKVHSEI